MSVSATPRHDPDGMQGRSLVRQAAGYFWFLAPALVVLAVLSIVPVLLTFYLGSTDLALAKPGSGHWIGLGNYTTMLRDAYFRSSVVVTLVLIGVPVALQMLLGLGLALLLHTDYPIIKVLRPLFITPMVIPPVVAGLMWKILYLPNLGGLNYLLGLAGIPPVSWFSSALMATVAIIIVATWEDTPFVMLLVLAALESLPSEPIEAAIVDGASAWQRFYSVVLPIIRPVLLTAMIFRLIGSLGIFPVIYVLTQGGPGRSTEVLNYYAYTQGFTFLNIGYASALAVALLVLVLALSLVLTTARLREGVAG
ncbi:MAG TPA: sugar ABC transporter permease [bacterium]|nr:sugar ABC transporter permease [bacterium]